MSVFGERLKMLRESRGLSQDDFASKFSLAQTTIGMYERGLREPNIEKLNQFATFFNVSLDYLVGRTNDPAKEYKPATRELLDMLHLSDDEIFARGPHTIDGKVLTRDEFKHIITAIRLKRQLDPE
jgi:transcriptional regulator with XRE-family HTH domain